MTIYVREMDTAAWAEKVRRDALARVGGNNGGGTLGFTVETNAPPNFELDPGTTVAARVDARKKAKVVPM